MEIAVHFSIFKQALATPPSSQKANLPSKEKRKRGQEWQDKVENAGGLSSVKDNNAALWFLDR